MSANRGCVVCGLLCALIEEALAISNPIDDYETHITGVVVYGFKTRRLPPYKSKEPLPFINARNLSYATKRALLYTENAGKLEDTGKEDWTTIDLVSHIPHKEDGIIRKQHGLKLELPHDLQLKDLVETAKDWIETCAQDHPFCYLPKDIHLPFRVLDVGDLGNIEVKLVEARDVPGEYVALSYCWGENGDILKTTTANINHHLGRIEWERFPQTFRDAIIITQSLRIRYLWIDSLCIVQDDLGDWETEAAKMGDVYTNSFLTIAATHASNGMHGLFPARCPSYNGNYRNTMVAIGPVEIRKRRTREGTSNILTNFQHRISDGHRNFADIGNLHFSDNCDASPLFTRAWAFQERILATRTLHVHAEELFWECKTCNRCECGVLDKDNRWWQREGPYAEYALGPTGLKGLFAQICSGSKSKQEIADFWLEVISLYTALTLTHEKDRLVGLSGLAACVSQVVDSKYLAGLWAFDLPRSLLWRRVETRSMIHTAYIRSRATTLSLKQTAGPECDTYLPTWSWAHLPYAQDQAAKYVSRLQKFTRSRYCDDANVKFVFAGCEPSGKHTFGSVKRGVIRLYGSFISEVCKFVERGQGIDRKSVLVLDKFGNAEIIWDDPVLESLPGQFKGETFFALLIGSVENLLASHRKMQRTQQALALTRLKKVPGAFVRIGVMEVAGLSPGG